MGAHGKIGSKSSESKPEFSREATIGSLLSFIFGNQNGSNPKATTQTIKMDRSPQLGRIGSKLERWRLEKARDRPTINLTRIEK
jgi:hypothetical protein